MREKMERTSKGKGKVCIYVFGWVGSSMRHSGSSLGSVGCLWRAGSRAHGLRSCGILVPWPEIELASLALEGRFLTTGPPGKFPRGSIPRLVSENRKTTFCPLLCPTKWNSKGGKDSRWLSLKQKWIFCKVNETEASGPSIHRLLPEPLQ